MEYRVVNDGLDQLPITALALQKTFLGRLSLGDIARNLGKANQIALFVPDRINDDKCPKAAAFLAYAPALRAEASGLACRRKGPLRKTIGAVLGCIENDRPMIPSEACVLLKSRGPEFQLTIVPSTSNMKMA